MPRKPTIPSICMHCGVGFLALNDPHRPTRGQFCTRNCWKVSAQANAIRQVDYACLQCGRPLRTYASWARQRPYCSDVCRLDYRRPAVRCARCGRQFRIWRSHLGVNGQGQYCSRACKMTPVAVKRRISTAATQRRRAHVAAAPGVATPDQIAARVAMWGGTCWMCRMAPGTAIDHVIPLSRGGTNWPANLRPACQPCNSRKHDRDYRLFT
jgi:5-methylcytosine-specific restriction endonuclease McrA